MVVPFHIPFAHETEHRVLHKIASVVHALGLSYHADLAFLHQSSQKGIIRRKMFLSMKNVIMAKQVMEK